MRQCIPNKGENFKLKEKSQVITNVTHVSQRSYKLQPLTCIKYLNIDFFKVHPCSDTRQHMHKHCPNYHNAKDRKRYGNFYGETMCQFITRGEKCIYGQQCTDSHSRVEQLYQYQTYKKKFCSHYPNNIPKCQYGQFCSFAHTEQEIRVQLIHNYEFDEDFYIFHYKTEFCPFNLTEHDKALCVYAHNLQDYRRNPSIYIYEPIPCYNWKLKEFIYTYDLGCSNGVNCNMCHGWKELQYHPNSYKINKCLEAKCRKGECPNHHSEKEKRVIDENVMNRCFRYVSRNRIIQGTFKAESQESFVPRYQVKTQIVLGTKSKTEDSNSDFLTKTFIHKKQSEQPQKNEKNERTSKQEIPKSFLNQSFADSENENESDNSDIQHQVNKLMLGE